MKGLKTTNQFINSTRHFFHVSEFLSYSKKKQLRKDKQRMNIVVWSYCSKRLLCGIHCFTISICDSVDKFNDGAE